MNMMKVGEGRTHNTNMLCHVGKFDREIINFKKVVFSLVLDKYFMPWGREYK